MDLILCCLGLFLSLSVGGRACISSSGATSPTPECDTQPGHICYITTHNIVDIVVSNDTMWSCTNNGITSLHYTPDCCSIDNIIDAVVNLTRGTTTTLDCSRVSTDPTISYVHILEIDAPPGSQVLLTVPNYDITNLISATDQEDRANLHIFNANSVTGDDFFLSSSNVVFVRATFSNYAQTQNLVISAQAFSVIDTIPVTTLPHQCSVSPPATGGNQWFTDPECESGMYAFNESCYLFNNAMADLSTARTNCEAIGSHLVYIKNSKEQDFLVSMLNTITPLPPELWIGIERTAQGERVWMDGTSTSRFSNFKERDGGRDCFQIRQQDAYRWADHDCNHMHAYICEQELGYHGYNPNHGGCIAFIGTLPTDINVEDAILLKFSYTITTFQAEQDMGRTSAPIVWTSNYISTCLPSTKQVLDQNGFEVKLSCDANFTSTGSWEVTFQARGTGRVRISSVQLLVYDETEPPTTRTVSLSSTSVPYTISSSSAGQHSTEPDVPSVTKQSTFLTQTSSPTSPIMFSLTTEDIMIQGDGRSSGLNGAVIPTIVVLLLFMILFIMIGVFFRRRRRSLSSSTFDQKSQTKGSAVAGVKNPSFDTDNEQHEYTECRNSVMSPAKTIHSGVLGNVKEHEYTELPTDATQDKQDKVIIYSEVGEEDYNVLFGGKERGDYHEYNIPDSDQGKPEASVPGKRLPGDCGRHPFNEKSLNVTEQSSVERGQKTQMLHKKVGSQNEAGDHAYQGLQTTDDESYTPLRLEIKSVNDSSKFNSDRLYDVLERDTNIIGQSSLEVYSSLDQTSDTEGVVYYESSDVKSIATLEYEDPVFPTGDASYDCLQRTPMTGTHPNIQSTIKHEVHPDVDDCLTPNAGNTYETLENPESQQDKSGNKGTEYSHLQRPLRVGSSPDTTAHLHTCSQYEKLKLH